MKLEGCTINIDIAFQPSQYIYMTYYGEKHTFGPVVTVEAKIFNEIFTNENCNDIIIDFKKRINGWNEICNFFSCQD